MVSQKVSKAVTPANAGVQSRGNDEIDKIQQL